MATKDKRKQQHSGSDVGFRPAKVLENIVDFSEDSVANGDVVQALDVPKGYYVERVIAEVITAEGAAATFDVGDGSDVDGYLDGVDANSTGLNSRGLTLTEGTPNTVTGYTDGKFYTADDTIDITALAAMSSAKVRVAAVAYDLRRRE